MAATCTVACNLPNGLHLDLRYLETGELVTRVVNDTLRPTVLRRVSVRGNARFVGIDDPNQPRRAHGFALTSGLDADHVATWFNLYKDKLDCIKNGNIFIAKTDNDATAQAREQQDQLSGLQPIKPGDLENPATNTDARLKPVIGTVESTG